MVLKIQTDTTTTTTTNMEIDIIIITEVAILVTNVHILKFVFLLNESKTIVIFLKVSRIVLLSFRPLKSQIFIFRSDLERFPSLISISPLVPIFYDKRSYQTIIFSPMGGSTSLIFLHRIDSDFIVRFSFYYSTID